VIGGNVIGGNVIGGNVIGGNVIGGNVIGGLVISIFFGDCGDFAVVFLAFFCLRQAYGATGFGLFLISPFLICHLSCAPAWLLFRGSSLHSHAAPLTPLESPWVAFRIGVSKTVEKV
jgi:hypothetical protein